MNARNRDNDCEVGRFIEDIPLLAREAFELANRECGTCRNTHALWPYIRLSRASIGVEMEGSRLEPLMTGLFASGRRKLLVAGAADTSLLALGARAGSNYGVEIVVLDRCNTPLEMCRRLGSRSALSVETIRQDLRDFTIHDRFDVILLHHTLQFVSANDQIDILLKLARALRPNGRLVHLFNVSRPISGILVAEQRKKYADWVIEELDHKNVPLPEPRDAFRARLTAHAKNRERHTGAFADPSDVKNLMQATGLKIESSVTIEPDVTPPYREFLSKLNIRRFVEVARRD
jgi:SAM-dependent methyltransferase